MIIKCSCMRVTVCCRLCQDLTHRSLSSSLLLSSQRLVSTLFMGLPKTTIKFCHPKRIEKFLKFLCTFQKSFCCLKVKKNPLFFSSHDEFSREKANEKTHSRGCWLRKNYSGCCGNEHMLSK